MSSQIGWRGTDAIIAVDVNNVDGEIDEECAPSSPATKMTSLDHVTEWSNWQDVEIRIDTTIHTKGRESYEIRALPIDVRYWESETYRVPNADRCAISVPVFV